MKRILVVHYSQTGQLADLVESICAPLEADDSIELVREVLEPERPYPYPWSFFEFLDVFPECVALDAPPNRPLKVDPEEPFDLVILAYQVWFLAPSLPVTAFLKSEAGRRLLKGRPVITVIGCRNMWARAQETMKGLLDDCGARLLDNLVLTDQGSSLASFVTTPRWLLSGRKEAFWGFPPAGIADQEIAAACRFGEAIRAGIDGPLDRPLLTGLRAVEADISQIQSEQTGYRSFRIWGRLIRKAGPPGAPARRPVLVLYLVFLILMIVTVVPLTMLLKRLTAPFLAARQQAMKAQYEQPSGSSGERMAQFRCQE